MTPLGASLIFVIISVIVSVFRHVFFQNSTLNAGDDSNISLSKIHTLTIQQQQQTKVPFNSLYEAYFRPQEKRQYTAPVPYNSYVLKKSILNNEGVYICDQKFAAIFEERTSCDGPESMCKWRTTINVYRLPYLKKQQEKILEIQGRVLWNQQVNTELKCRKKQISQWQHHYELNFVLLHRSKQSKKGAGWTMNSLIIEQQQHGWKKNSSFTIKMMKWNLKNVYHYPLIYSFDDKCLSYVTEQEPWIIHFNCGLNWTKFNILHPKVQNTLFSKSNLSLFQPSYSSTHHVNPLFMQLFQSAFKIYTKPESCTGACPRQQIKDDKISNSHFRFGNTVAQLTIAINDKMSIKQNEGLVSFNILYNDLNHEKEVFIDCGINTKDYKIIKGLYTYQLGLQIGQDHTVASIDRHSLICVCSYNYIQILRIIEIEDLLGNFNISDVPSQLLVRSRQNLQQLKLQNSLVRKQASNKQSAKSDEDDQDWFSFDFLDLSTKKDVPQKQKVITDEQSTVQREYYNQQSSLQNQRKQKKGKQKQKRQEKKQRGKKIIKKQKKQAPKLLEDLVGQKLTQLTQNFEYLGHQKPIQSEIQLIQIPMPFTLTTQSKIRILSTDLEYPIIYIQTLRKFLLTYQLKQFQQDQYSKNILKKSQYAYKYSELGVAIKPPENYIRTLINDSNKTVKMKEEIQVDKYLLQIIQHNSNVLNQVKSIVVVDARYDQSSAKLSKIKGLTKPNRKHIIVAWGWGFQVYEMNWDRKNLNNQLAKIEEQLNSNTDGIQMLTILPFIELFATVYCLFQTLITTR